MKDFRSKNDLGLILDYGHTLISEIESDTCCAYQKLVIQMAEVQTITHPHGNHVWK